MPSLKSAAAASALIGIFRLLLCISIIVFLYFGQYLLIPFTLAILLTFILSPVVNKIEYYLGRLIAVSAVIVILFFVIGSLGYILSAQFAELGADLPKYKTNIETKLKAFDLSKDNSLALIFTSIEKLENYLPGAKNNIPNTNSPTPVKVIDTTSTNIHSIAKNIIVGVFDVLTSTGLVFLLLIFMLFTREDLRARLIRLIGPTRVSQTALAMDDASQRITHYLVTQLGINFVYGLIIAIGLFFIGVPNAILWGILAMILRFIPYLGSLIAVIIPFIIALAVSSDWMMPFLTLLLFIVLDLIMGNIIEPLLFGARTGISPLALIISAVFWTLLWGPVGLLLSTPLTVCLIVIGRHIPQLSFLNVLLSDEKGLALYEEFYQSLLNFEFTEAMVLINNYLKKQSILELYDSTVLPVLSAIEIDRRNDLFEESQVNAFYQNIQFILDEVFAQAAIIQKEKKAGEKTVHPENYRVLCIPATSERDEIASNMLMHVLVKSLFKGEAIQNFKISELIEFIAKENFNAICISVVTPGFIFPAKKLLATIHQKFPTIKIIIGLLGITEIDPEIEDSLKKAGANAIVFTFAQAIFQLEKSL